MQLDPESLQNKTSLLKVTQLEKILNSGNFMPSDTLLIQSCI